MAFDPQQRRQALQAFMDQHGLKVAPWEALSGLGDGTLRKFMDDKTGEKTLTDKTYGKLAAGAQKRIGRPVSVAELQGVLPAPHAASELGLSTPPSNATIAPGAPRPPGRNEMEKDVPVYGTIVGGNDNSMADFELNGQIVDYVRRPPRLAGRTDIFAAYYQGESMLYWREPGQLVYFEKAKPPRVNDYVLVELKPPAHDHDGVRPALIKRLIGVTPTKIKLRQYYPTIKDFEIERSKILQLIRALDWDELMGV